MSRSRLNRGFSLIELMIVVSIIGILGVIAVSTLGDSEVDAMEKQVVSNFRSISAAQLVYRSGKGSYGKVGDLIGYGKGLIDGAWDQGAAGKLDESAGGVRRGAFNYTMYGGGAGSSAYAVFAEPAEGAPHSYGMTKDGVIYILENKTTIPAASKAITFDGTGFKILQ